MLSIRNLEVAYGATQALWDVSLDVGDGEIVALIGANGAGKSTLLSAISMLVPPRGGSIEFDGHELTRLTPDRVVALGLAQAPQGRRLFPGMTVLQNLKLGAYLRSNAAEVRRDLERVLTLFPMLAERAGQLAGSMSGGQQQMCAIGRALMTRPKLLAIDELSLGLAPVVVDQLLPVLRAINQEGTAILLVEQDVQVALEQATRGYVLETGRVVLSGPSAELLGDARVKTAYLGT